MSQVRRTSPYVAGLDEDDGTVKPIGADGYVALGVDSYLFPLGVADQPLESIHIQTDADIAGVFTIETSNLGRNTDATAVAPADAVTDWDTASVGAWVKEDPSTAYVATVGTGWTVSNLTLTKTAGTGGAMIHLGNLGSRRVRLKAAITTGGSVRVAVHGKA